MGGWCLLLRSQVIRDFRGVVGRPAAQASEEQQASLRARIAKFMTLHVPDKEQRDDPQRLSNLITVKALDHALQSGLGLSLAAFRAAQPMRALAADERRFWSAASDLPPSVCSRGEARRAAPVC